MGLDIIPCFSLDWDKSLASIDAFNDFNDSVDFETWFPDWHRKFNKAYMAGDNSLHPMNFPENREKYNSRLMSYCELYGFHYRDDVLNGNFVGRIDDGIRRLEEYALRSSNNEGGANNILRASGLSTLRDIFGIHSEGRHDYFAVDFSSVRFKSLKLIDELKDVYGISDDYRAYVDGQIRLILRFAEVARINGYSKYRLFWLP